MAFVQNTRRLRFILSFSSRYIVNTKNKFLFIFLSITENKNIYIVHQKFQFFASSEITLFKNNLKKPKIKLKI